MRWNSGTGVKFCVSIFLGHLWNRKMGKMKLIWSSFLRPLGSWIAGLLYHAQLSAHILFILLIFFLLSLAHFIAHLTLNWLYSLHYSQTHSSLASYPNFQEYRQSPPPPTLLISKVFTFKLHTTAMILLSCAVSVAHSLLHVPTQETLSIPILKNQEHWQYQVQVYSRRAYSIMLWHSLHCGYYGSKSVNRLFSLDLCF
jgi:hypothetical protein